MTYCDAQVAIWKGGELVSESHELQKEHFTCVFWKWGGYTIAMKI